MSESTFQGPDYGFAAGCVSYVDFWKNQVSEESLRECTLGYSEYWERAAKNVSARKENVRRELFGE